MYIHLCHKDRTMKKAILFIALLAGVSAVKAQDATGTWANDASHSTVKFTVSHLTVSEVDGRFKTFGGSISATEKDFNNAKVTFDVDVNSVNTDNEKRDEHLKSDDFFNAAKYPKMSFTSTSFKKVKGNQYKLEGNLTIRDVTQKVIFDVTNGGITKDPWGNIKTGFKATGKISRKSFHLTWNTLTEAGGAVVGDEVSMTLNLEFSKNK